MIRFTHPCGHEDEMLEEQWYHNEGDCPWPCEVCEAARQQEREANTAFLTPLHTFLNGYAPICARMGWCDDEPYGYDPDPEERAWRADMWKVLEALRLQTIAAMDAGLDARARALVAQDATHPYLPEDNTPELDLASLLHNLETAHDRLHNPLWCAENGIQLHEGNEAFWLLDVDQAEERLTAEMWRRARQYTPLPPRSA